LGRDGDEDDQGMEDLVRAFEGKGEGRGRG